MVDKNLTHIIQLCLGLDEKARDFYMNLSNYSTNDELKRFWEYMSQAEKEHIAFWKKILKLAEQKHMPQIFDDTGNIIHELEEIDVLVQNLLNNTKKTSDIKESFLVAYQIEFHLLHRSFLSFFQFARMFYPEANIETAYENHIQEFIDALNKYGNLTIELKLLGETLKRLWNERKTLVQFSYTDELTGIYNRRGFLNLIKPITYLAQRNNYSIGIMMVDIDRFKRVNDTLGHAKGDEVLMHVTKIIKNTIRTSDILARYGGEEFIIFVPSTKPNLLYKIADKIRGKVEQETKKYVGITISVGLSSGVLRDTVDEEFNVLLNKADGCLYEAKKTGGNRVVMCNT